VKAAELMSDLTTSSELVPTARTEGTAVVLSLRGEIDLHNSAEVRIEVLGLINRNKPVKLVINLDQVPYMDSSAIAVLVESVQKMRKSGGSVCLTNIQARVRSVLDIAHLNSIFTITADEQEALSK
jgi:anti-sigma B factor antagonist